MQQGLSMFLCPAHIVYAGTPGHSMARQGKSPGDEAFILALGGHPR